MNKRILLSIIACSVLLVTVGCGGSSDHGNGHYSTISGVVKKTNGDPAAETKILIMPDTLNYAADSAVAPLIEVFTDETGRFEVDSVGYGNYCISGLDSWSRGEFVIKGVEVSGLATELGVIELAVPGTVIFPVDSLRLHEGSVLYLPGLPIFHVIDTGAVQWIDGIPAGEVELRGYDPATGQTIDLGVQYHLVDVLPGQSLFLAYRLDVPKYCLDSVTTIGELEGTPGVAFRFRVAPFGVNPTGEFFRFSWGDGSESVWSRRYDAVHTWDRAGVYYVQTQMKYGETFVAWSEPLVITIMEAGN